MVRSLCFLAALVVAALASPVSEESVELKKRIIAGLLGGKGGLLGGEGGLLGDLLGGKEGGLVGDLLGGGKEGGLLGGILGGLLGGEEGGFLGGILGIVTGLLDTVLGLLASLTSGLSGKTEQPDIYAEFQKYPLNQLCPVCGGLPNAQHVSACKQFCSEKGWKGTA